MAACKRRNLNNNLENFNTFKSYYLQIKENLRGDFHSQRHRTTFFLLLYLFIKIKFGSISIKLGDFNLGLALFHCSSLIRTFGHRTAGKHGLAHGNDNCMR